MEIKQTNALVVTVASCAMAHGRGGSAQGVNNPFRPLPQLLCTAATLLSSRPQQGWGDTRLEQPVHRGRESAGPRG